MVVIVERIKRNCERIKGREGGKRRGGGGRGRGKKEERKRRRKKGRGREKKRRKGGKKEKGKGEKRRKKGRKERGKERLCLDLFVFFNLLPLSTISVSISLCLSHLCLLACHLRLKDIKANDVKHNVDNKLGKEQPHCSTLITCLTQLLPNISLVV